MGVNKREQAWTRTEKRA